MTLRELLDAACADLDEARARRWAWLRSFDWRRDPRWALVELAPVRRLAGVARSEAPDTRHLDDVATLVAHGIAIEPGRADLGLTLPAGATFAVGASLWRRDGGLHVTRLDGRDALRVDPGGEALTLGDGTRVARGDVRAVHHGVFPPFAVAIELARGDRREIFVHDSDAAGADPAYGPWDLERDLEYPALVAATLARLAGVACVAGG